MRNKLALTIALASFGVVTALGVGFAGADQLSGAEATETIAPLSTIPAVPSATQPACCNEIDDDVDGLVDAEDPDCRSPADTSEEPEASTGTSIEAPPAPAGSTAPQPPRGGVKAGTTIDGRRR